MKVLPAALMTTLVGLCVTGCGGASKDVSSTSRSSSSSSSSIASSGATTVVFGTAHTLRGLKGDEEDDESESKSEGSNPGGDEDRDSDYDYQDNLGKGYYDGDDGAVKSYGHEPSARDERALTAVVRRYSDAAAAGDGATACSLIAPTVARALPEDYGQGGAPYLRGAASCQAVMSRLFTHSHNELTGAIEVTGVRVDGNRAYVLLGSGTRVASYVTLVREGGAWKMDVMVGAPLP
jgi:hypothetical protein